MQVKITYTDGTIEEVRNIPTKEIAAGIYAEACGNMNVQSAELWHADGTHASAYRAAVDMASVCGSMPPSKVPECKPCARRSGHIGRHYAALDGAAWA